MLAYLQLNDKHSGVYVRFVEAIFVDIHFDKNELKDGWYNGKYHFVMYLTIITDYLHSINANAFNTNMFCKLIYLHVNIKYGSLKVHDGALNGLSALSTVTFEINQIDELPDNLFSSVASSLMTLEFVGWPSSTGMDDIFAGSVYELLICLQISDVQLPQTRFRVLAQTHFVTFRIIGVLRLVNCGIEVIDERAFDGIARTLTRLDLSDNRIKFVDIEMFRKIFETKTQWAKIRIKDSGEMACTCRFFELAAMFDPFMQYSISVGYECYISNEFAGTACGAIRDVNLSRICIRPSIDTRGSMRIVNVQKSYIDGLIRISTNFTSKYRVLLVNLDAMSHDDCAERVSRMKSRCLNMHAFADGFHWNDIDEVRDTEIVLITTIPILYRFGARPMHLITVNQAHVRPNHQCSHCISIWVAILCAVLGFVAGFGGSICAKLIKNCHAMANKQRKHSTIEQPIEYESYGYPTGLNELTMPVDYEYDEMELQSTAFSNDYI